MKYIRLHSANIAVHVPAEIVVLLDQKSDQCSKYIEECKPS